MDERIGRLLAAGNRLKGLIETSQPGLSQEGCGVVTHWNEAVELVLDHSAGAAGRVTGASAARDFDYLAFDIHSQELLAFGSMAVFALQNADEAHPHSTIEIQYAGPLGRRIWDQKLDLASAVGMIRALFPLPDGARRMG
jgi:hypothetical protein